MEYKFDRDLRVRCIECYEKHFGIIFTPEEADEVLQDLANLYTLLSESGECSDDSCA